MRQLTSVARYQRVIGASLERVWENVLDWEHLPWLHADSFQSIECIDAGDWGWRARVVPQDGSGVATMIELVIDLPASRYVTRTLDGVGTGSEIWTHLDRQSERETAIAVDFRMADIDPPLEEALGKMWLALYERLWDEDEVMMQERQRQLDAHAGSEPEPDTRCVLGVLEEVRARLPFVFELGGRRFRLIEIDGELVPHSTVCPHSLGPLDEASVDEGILRCPWHGYRFDVQSGEACHDPKLRLMRAPRIEVDPRTNEVHAVTSESV